MRVREGPMIGEVDATDLFIVDCRLERFMLRLQVCTIYLTSSLTAEPNGRAAREIVSERIVDQRGEAERRAETRLLAWRSSDN